MRQDPEFNQIRVQMKKLFDQVQQIAHEERHQNATYHLRLLEDPIWRHLFFMRTIYLKEILAKLMLLERDPDQEPNLLVLILPTLQKLPKFIDAAVTSKFCCWLKIVNH
jgi:hypothetical protein